jgi:hypothetical protein
VRGDHPHPRSPRIGAPRAGGMRTRAAGPTLGGLAERVGGEAVLVVALVFVGVATVVAFAESAREDPGMTTEIAVVLAFLLGALAQRDAALSAGIAVVVALVLFYRESLHRLVRDVLSEQELHDGLLAAERLPVRVRLEHGHGRSDGGPRAGDPRPGPSGRRRGGRLDRRDRRAARPRPGRDERPDAGERRSIARRGGRGPRRPTPC